MKSIQLLPESPIRIESGPVRFGTDWPGTFIRGDECGSYAASIRAVLNRKVAEVMDEPAMLMELEKLARLLESSNLTKRSRTERRSG